MELIRLEKLAFAYPERPCVFEELDFCLSSRERIGILGANGAGKSTLFQLAMGLLPALKGRVFGLGKELKREKDFKALREQVGYLFQDSDDQLFCPTVLEDVAFGPLNLGMPRDKIRQTVALTLARLGLEGFEQRVTYRLSGGEKRLVALASVLAMQPKAILLDEPMNGLDEEHAGRLEHILLDSELGWAMISHDQAQLARLCEKIFRLKDGRLYPA